MKFLANSMLCLAAALTLAGPGGVAAESLPSELVAMRPASSRSVVPAVLPQSDCEDEQQPVLPLSNGGYVQTCGVNGPVIRRFAVQPPADAISEGPVAVDLTGVIGWTRPGAATREAPVGRVKPGKTRSGGERLLGSYYVQVGMYRDEANAAQAKEKLRAVAQPVAVAHDISKGRPVQLVLAGPFADAAEAGAALALLRQSGFADAYIRR